LNVVQWHLGSWFLVLGSGLTCWVFTHEQLKIVDIIALQFKLQQ